MKNLIIWLNRIISKHKAMKRWKRIVTVLAAILTFATTYALILPAITVERNKTEDVAGLYLEQEKDRDDMLLENALEPTGISIAAEHENAVTFSYADDSMTATAIFGTDEYIPEGAELVVNPVDTESKEYADLSSRSFVLLDREFIYDVTTCSFYDFALVCDNVDVTPKTGLVDIHIIFHDNTIEHEGEALYAGRFARPSEEADGFEAMSEDAKTASAYITGDELVWSNPDEYPAIELTDGIITAISLKGSDLAQSDSLVGVLAGYIDEEIKAAAIETDAEIPDYDDSQEEDAVDDPEEADGEEAVPTDTIQDYIEESKDEDGRNAERTEKRSVSMPRLLAAGSTGQLDDPDPHKNLVPNEKEDHTPDGTYTLSLSVKGDRKTGQETRKKNVLFVMDRSSSMNRAIRYMGPVDTSSTDYRGSTDNGSTTFPVRYQNGRWERRNMFGQWTEYDAERYGLYLEEARLPEEQRVLKDLFESLLGNNEINGENSEDDNVEIKVISFASKTGVDQGWQGTESGWVRGTNSASLDSAVDKTSTDRGTNWEEALKYAKREIDTKKQSDGSREDYIIVFLTDGAPTATTAHKEYYYGTEGHDGMEDSDHRPRNSCEPAYEDATDDARSLIVDANGPTGYELYNIFTYGTNDDYKYLVRLTNYAYGDSDYIYDDVWDDDEPEDYFPDSENAKKYFTNAQATEDLETALRDIFREIAVQKSYGQTKITDGLRQDAMTFNITDGKPTSAVYTVTPEGSTDPLYTVTASMPVNGGDPVVTFRIYDSTHPDGFYEMPGVWNENVANPDDPLNSYDSGVYYSVTIPSQDSGPDTVYKMALAEIQNGNQLVWDLQPVGELMDGCTYKAEFIVWPNQDAYDYVSALNNGLGTIPDFNNVPQGASDTWDQNAATPVMDSEGNVLYYKSGSTEHSNLVYYPGDDDDYDNGVYNGRYAVLIPIVWDQDNAELVEDEDGDYYRAKPIMDDNGNIIRYEGGCSQYPSIAYYPGDGDDYEHGIYNGRFAVLTNDGQQLDYSIVTREDGDVTKVEPQTPIDLEYPDPMRLEDTKSKLAKQWNVDRDPGLMAQYLYEPDGTSKKFKISFDIFQGDSTVPYKTVTIGWKDDPTYPQGGYYDWESAPMKRVKYGGQWYNIGTRWAADFSISAGLMLSYEQMLAYNMDPQYYDYDYVEYEGTTYYILEPGHDYTIKEQGENVGYEFDFDAPVYHPMLVDGVLRNVEFKSDGTVKMSPAGTNLSALQIDNSLRGYIKLDKKVVDKNNNEIPYDDTRFEYEIKLQSPTDPGPFVGTHIPWFGIGGLYYNDGHDNYYQIDKDTDADNNTIWVLTNENGDRYKVASSYWEEEDDGGNIIVHTEPNPDRAEAQTITYYLSEDPVETAEVTIYGNQMVPEVTHGVDDDDEPYDIVSTTKCSAIILITQGEILSIANVPVGTTYTITEILDTDDDRYEEYDLIKILRQIKIVEETIRDDGSTELIELYDPLHPDVIIQRTPMPESYDDHIIGNRDNHVTFTNKVNTYKLQITKNVTVDGQPTTTDWADGEYSFTIVDADGKPAHGRVNGTLIEDGKVSITIRNGQQNTVTVTDMLPGVYTITEDTPHNGTALVGANGRTITMNKNVINDDTPTPNASFTNNINTTQIEVQKVWTDDGQPDVDHSGQVINYEIYRTPYVMVEDPDNPGEMVEQVYGNQVRVDGELVPTMQGYTGSLQYSNNPLTRWKEVVTTLPKTGVEWDQDEEEFVYITYKYTVKETTIIEGYKTMITGGEIADSQQPGEYSYAYTITNEPLGPLDQETHIDVKKQWKKADGTSDSDPHRNDIVYFKATQKKYEARVTYEYNDVTYENIPLYPITVVLKDEGGVPGSGHDTNEELSTVVYVPAGAEFNITPTEGPGQPTVPGDHYVRGYGFGVGSEVVNHTSGQTYTIDHVNSATEITLDLNAGNDTWVASLEVNDNYRKWMVTMDSPQGIIWHLEELQDRVLENIKNATHADPVPYADPVEYSYTIELKEGANGLYTYIDIVGNAPGHGAGSATVLWEGSVTHLPLYEYKEGENGAGDTSYIYTYEVAETAINTDAVNTTDPPADWKGQTTYYLATWDQNKNKESEDYNLWTLTNQKKPPIDVTLYKVDKNNIPDSSTRLEGAKFKLVKKKLVRAAEEGDHRWVWSKDTDWGTAGESEEVSENAQNPGIFSFGNLDAGYYEIVETKRPLGYIQANENPVFKVRYNNGSVVPEIVLVYASGSDIGQPVTGNATDMVSVANKAIVVGNELGAALPHTGGLGTNLFYLAGILLTGIAGASLLLRKRRRTV